MYIIIPARNNKINIYYRSIIGDDTNDVSSPIIVTTRPNVTIIGDGTAIRRIELKRTTHMCDLKLKYSLWSSVPTSRTVYQVRKINE